MAEAIYLQPGCSIDLTPTAAVTAGEVLAMPDGRAGVAPTAIAAGVKGAMTVEGIVQVAKTASMVMLQGSRVYWDHSANAAHLLQVNDEDFYLGLVQETAASAGTTVKVAINADPRYSVSLGDGFTSVPVLTAGTATAIIGHAEGVSLALDATAEAQKMDALGLTGIAPGCNCLVEALIAVNVSGGAAADINIGLANATHATTADDITESLFIHFDGGTLDILAESDDGTTEVAATDTTKNAVADTPFLAQWDLSDNTDIQLYIDGVNVLPSSVFKLNAATGPLRPFAHIEKTSDAAVGNYSVLRLGIRIREE